MNKKLIFYAAVTAVVILGGCGGGGPQPQSANSNIGLGGGYTVAYAYLEDGEKLTKISTDYVAPKDDEEVVKINSRGFYPNYNVPKESQSCIYSAVISNDKEKNTDKYRYCHSNFVVSTMGGKAIDIFTNALMTVSSAGLNAATGTVTRTMEFDREKFLDSVKENSLDRYRKRLIEAYSLAERKKREVESLYDSMFKEYRDKMNNVLVTYKTVDRSGLAPKGYEIEEMYTLELNMPQRKRFDYTKELSFVATPSDFDSKLAKAVEEIELKSAKDKEQYRKYLADNFKSFRLKGPKELEKRYNDNITFHAVAEAPEFVDVPKDSKRTVEVVYAVEYADLTNMFPKEYTLEDSNMEAKFYPAAKGYVVTVIGANKTRSFITLKSITMYYGGSVNNISNANREIAPESVTLASNSGYNLISPKIADLAHIERATLNSIKGKKVNYGYALKYRVEKTNVDKSMYDTSGYSLLSIYRSYL